MTASPGRDDSGLSLRAYGLGSPLFEAALDVYARVWPDRDRAHARENFARFAGFAAFRGFVVCLGGKPVGLGYGADCRPGHWWHDQVTAQLGPALPVLKDAWRLIELAVLPEHRGRGIGTWLHNALVEAQPCPRVLLTTNATNDGAKRLYERLGWTYVHAGFAFPGEPGRYAIMAKEVRRERSTPSPPYPV